MSSINTNNIKVQNAQFILYYLLVATDGAITDKEKSLFLDIITKNGGFTRSYSESVFNAMQKFPKALNYNHTIESFAEATYDQKLETIRILRELSFADGTYHKDELSFIMNVQKDLGLHLEI